MKKYLSKLSIVKKIYRVYRILNSQYGFSFFRWLNLVPDFTSFWQEYRTFKAQNDNDNFAVEVKDWSPYLQDKTAITPVEPVYFFQDTWAARKIFEIKPKHHYDIGSSVKTIGILSQFVPLTMVDIRPIDVELENLYFQEGSILDLPFADNSIESISSLCVIEHIGLGRYGDPLDAWGSEKAIKELKRVTQKGGIILFSVPVDNRNKVYFNANRAFTRDYILELFAGCELVEEKYQYGKKLYDNYKPDWGFGTGLFMFKKRS